MLLKTTSLKATIRPRNQMTLPTECLSVLGLSVNDTLTITVINGKLIMTPVKRKSDALEKLHAFEGAFKGNWGDTPEDVERNIREARDSWSR